MSQPNGDPNDGNGDGERTFTKAEFARELNKQVRQAVAKVREEYGDYDDLKAKAAEADKGASQLDKMQQQLTQLTTQNEKLARDGMIRRVADKLGIPVSKAERLRGNTEAELLADGEDFFADWKRPDKDPDGGSESEGEDGNEGNKRQRQTPPRGNASDGDDGKGGRPASTRQRPRETLRSGTPTGGRDEQPEETDPLKLAALVKTDY